MTVLNLKDKIDNLKSEIKLAADSVDIAELKGIEIAVTDLYNHLKRKINRCQNKNHLIRVQCRRCMKQRALMIEYKDVLKRIEE
jgi:hypothetical protein